MRYYDKGAALKFLLFHAALAFFIGGSARASPRTDIAKATEGARLSMFDRALGDPRALFCLTDPDALPAGGSKLTAVYDIKAHLVIMPDGTRLEAHSGLGNRADNPRFVHERLRGATPPALYALVPLARPFHGVAALRLVPIEGRIFGRTDLLAHTYMLRGRPESLGCVVFADYASFLQAFLRGQIKRLRVRPSVGEAALRIA